jgi:hypothetical protein
MRKGDRTWVRVETGHILFETTEGLDGLSVLVTGYPSHMYPIYHDIYHVLIDIVSDRLDRQIIKPITL